MKVGICKLCLKEKELLKQSHIIPNFMFKALNKENEGMFFTTFNSITRLFRREEKRFTGEFDKDILCVDCDNKLLGSIYESYAHKTMFFLGDLPKEERPILSRSKTLDGLDLMHCANINYKKYKLFLLSILWRASVSKRPFYNAVNLGQHEELIRKMIYEGNPGKHSDYPISVSSYINDKNSIKELISKPQMVKNEDGEISFTFLIDGWFYFFHLSCDVTKIPKIVLFQTIKPENEMYVVIWPIGTSQQKVLRFSGFIR